MAVDAAEHSALATDLGWLLRQNYISQRLGIDRTVMTTLLDDLETAELRRPP